MRARRALVGEGKMQRKEFVINGVTESREQMLAHGSDFNDVGLFPTAA